MSGRSGLAEVLRRTRLVRVLLVYLGGAFAALEAVDLLGDKLALPDWVFAGAVALLLIGLPIVVATALIQAGATDSPRSVAPPGDDRRRLVFAANLLSQDYSYYRILGKDLAVALDELSVGSFGHDTVSHFFYHLARGWRHTRLGDSGAATVSYDSARVVLENGLRRWPNDAFWRRELGVALAGLGRKDEAVAEARRSVEIVSPAANSVFGAENVERLAQVLAMVGEREVAPEQLETLQSVAPWLSGAYLRIDPIWAPLREDPRFQHLTTQDR